MNLHIQKYRQNWIAKEAVRVWEEQREEFYPHPVPPWAGEATGHSCLKEARLRIHNRIKTRQKKIKTITKSIQTMLIEKHAAYKRVHEKGYAKQEIAIKVHHTLERAHALRKQVRERFKVTQKKKMFYAKKHQISGAKAMRERYEQRMESIERASIGVIRQIFEEYQQPMPQHLQPKPEQALKKEFDQEM